MDALRQDLRYALRQLRRSPSFALAAVLTLALGIGLATSVFGLVDALLFRPLPGVEDPGRLVAVHTDQGDGPGVSSYMDFVDLRRQMGAFERVAAFKPRSVDVLASSGTRRVRGALVTHDYFATVGVRPAVGRFFRPDEDEVPGRDAVAVLAHGYWTSEYGADPAALGATLTLNGRAFTIVGVAQEGFRGTSLHDAPDVFVPMAMQPHLMPASGLLLDRRGWGGVHVIGRLAPGVTRAAARAELGVVGARLAREHPATNRDRSFVLAGFREATMAPGVRADVLGFGGMLMGLVLLVLLLACVNVANLLLARAARRREEVALRSALGASRSRLVRQLLTESVLLAGCGGAAGVLLARWTSGLLESVPLGFELDVGVDLRVLAFATAVTILTGLAFGLAPAVRAARPAVIRGLGESAIPVARRGPRLVEALVVVQVALSLAVLAAAGVLGRTLLNLRSADPGFDTDGVLTARVDPSLQGYDGERLKAYYRDLREAVSATPGVSVAALSSRLPGTDSDRVSIAVEGFRPPGDERLLVEFSLVSRDYFRAMGIPVLRGRTPTGADEGGPPVVWVDEGAARRLEDLTGRDALDARIGVEGPAGPYMQVVGVVPDTRQRGAREGPAPHLYVEWERVPADESFAEMALVVRTDGPPDAMTGAVRAAVSAIDPRVPLLSVRPLARHLDDGVAAERLAANILAAGGLLALALASLGLYGVLANAVNRRTSEIGIRIALGADAGRVLRSVLARGLALTSAGLVLGLGLAAAAGRALAGFLYGVSWLDAATLGGVAATLVAVSLLASWVPARRAARVDPIVALRAE